MLQNKPYTVGLQFVGYIYSAQTYPNDLRVTHEETSCCVWSTCGSQSQGLKSSVRLEKTRRKPHLKTRITTVFVQSPSQTRGFTKASYCHREAKPQRQKEGPVQATSIILCVLYTGLKYSQNMVALSQPETCLLRLWASCF